MNFFRTFRFRLLFILAFLLIATLSVQYYLNLQTERANESLRETQEQALVSSVALVFNSFKYEEDRIKDLIEKEGQQFFDEKTKDRIKDIIVINDKWEVYDSTNEKYFPTKNEDGKYINVKLKDISDLPPIVNAYRLGEDGNFFPLTTSSSDTQAHAIRIETFDQGRWYIIVILKTGKGDAFLRAAEPLIYTLAVLLIATLITVLLVWRFTRPIAQLSNAAKKVAEGDFQVRVQGADRTDELGKLAARFNEMTAELEKKSELEEKLQQVEKSAVVGRLASAIAHEIRNPLNYINLTLDHLKAKFLPDNEKQRDQFEKLTTNLKTEVDRINQLVSDFLRYSRPLKLELKPASLHDVIESSLKIVEGQAEEQGVKIIVAGNDSNIKIFADAEILRSVFNNLFINAVQAMPAGGTLQIAVSPGKNMIKVKVTDTGQGISVENLPKIFEPYFSTKETGTGLGLAIVKRIVDEHRGVINVESKEGEGAKFEVELPKAD